MDEDEYIEDDDSEDAHWLIISGRAETQGEFKKQVVATIDDDEFSVFKVYPLGSDSEQRYYIAVAVGKGDVETARGRLRLRLYAVDVFDTGDECHSHLFNEYGKSMYQEAQAHPLTVKEWADFEMLHALTTTGRIVLLRGMLDGEPVPLLAHVVDIPSGDQLATPIAIMLNDALQKRVVNPLA